MKGRVIFLVEELSMKRALQAIMPKLFPTWEEKVHWLAIPHHGKSDLEKSVPRKLRAWNVPNDRFVIMRDNDGGDCRRLKSRLRELAADRAEGDVLIRIVMQELESWFLGDFDALVVSYPKLNFTRHRSRAKFRDPDALTNASEELGKLIPGYRKTAGASTIAKHLDLASNHSQSLQSFVTGLRTLVETMALS